LEEVWELERKPEIEGDLSYSVFCVEQHVVGLCESGEVSWWDVEDFSSCFYLFDVTVKYRLNVR
jgi:uncharacterized protein YhbP (UPF0306 family)